MTSRSLAGKRTSVALLILTQIAVLSLWFSSAAVLPEMGREAGLDADYLAWLSTAVQLGFAGGALVYAALGFADRFDPRRVFMLSALAGAAANLALLAVPIGGWAAVVLRLITGAMMAGVYPVGMKIAAGWGRTDRALLISLLVGALTIGSASPYMMAFFGGADWRATIWASTLVAAAGGVTIPLRSGHAHGMARPPFCLNDCPDARIQGQPLDRHRFCHNWQVNER